MTENKHYGSLIERFKWTSSYECPEHPSLVLLDAQMKRFYREEAIRQGYHQLAESGNLTWDDHPLHKAVIEMIGPGDTVVEFSCGSGYSVKHFLKTGCRYIGFDLPAQELARTKRAMPFARLVAGNAYQAPFASASADLVVSFYSLEHVVWPQRYLNEMLRVARCGGHVALAFPDYVADPKMHCLGSMRFGRSPGGIRHKIARSFWLDAIQSIIERKLLYRRQVGKLRKSIYGEKRVRFLINTVPICLATRYESDNDAIYFASEEEVAQYLIQRGCTIRKLRRDVANAQSGNALVIAQVLSR